MKIVVGLGNPGSRYEGTRHNVGFLVVDLLIQAAVNQGGGKAQKKFDAECVEWKEAGEKIWLMKPQTFMNLSGRSVRQAVDFYQVAADDVLVVCDDVNLPLGKLRIRSRGSAGGHNGLKDIQSHLGTQEYPRLRIGVGGLEGKVLADYVLDRFRPGEKADVEDAVIRAAQAVEAWVRQGIEVCMNQFN